MERTCSQTIKIPFPIRIFYGTEVTVDIPKTGGEILKNIKLVIDFSSAPNTLGSTIVERAEVLVDDEVIQTTYGEFIQVENVLITPAEKYDKLLQLLCVNSPGAMYMSIPFEDVLLQSKTQIRILFSSELQGELKGHLLVDYYLYENPPKFPFVQKTTQVQRFSRTVNNPKSLKMSVYAVGPVYQLYFTVKDLSTGSYVEALTNVALNFGEKERFNLTGKYLRYVEPVKRLQTYSSEPVYMYSFCLNPETPSGSTHFPPNSYFVLDFYDNSSTYEVTIWAKSHDFLYTTENTTKRIFESTEMLLDTTTSSSTFQGSPMRVSYINYSGSVVLFYSSPNEITNVAVTTTAPNYNVTQSTVEFTKLDSVNSVYTANVVFSFQGFQDVTCYFRFKGYSTYLDNVVYTGQGNYPTHIDLGQNFHYLLGNVFDFSNVVFTSNIQSLTIDDQKNYAFTTYTTGTCNILGDGSFTGPGSIIAKYDQNMNLLFTVTTSNSNVTELASSNTYGLSFAQSGTVVSRDIGYSYTASAGTANVFVDSVTPVYASIRFGVSSSNILVNSVTTNFGNGTNRVCLASASASPIVVSNISQVKTALGTFSNGQTVWSFMYSSTSASSSSSVVIPASSNGYIIWSQGWSKTISNVSASGFDSKILIDQMKDSVYLVAGYTSTTPSLFGFTFATGTGFFVVKFDRSGNTKYVVSFVSSGILGFSPMLDSTTGRFMISVTSQLATTLNIYNSTGTLSYGDIGRYQFFTLDDYGSVSSRNIDLSEIFAVSKPLYFNPLCSSVFFSKPTSTTPNYTYWYTASNGPSTNEQQRYVSTDSKGDIYSIVTVSGGSSNIFDKYGDTFFTLTPISTSDSFITNTFSNCVSARWFSRITNCETILDNYILVNNDYIYVLVTTLSGGTTRIYDRTGSTVGPTLTGRNLLVVKFNLNGTYANMYLYIASCYGQFLSKDSSGNLYISGNKDGTAQQNIVTGTGTVGNIPLTTRPYTGFVIKISSSDSFSWVSYVDGVYDGFYSYTCAASDSLGNVYLASRKNKATAIINSTLNTVPVTAAQFAFFVVKFNSSGTYASWYSHFDSDSSRWSDLNAIAINNRDEVALTTNIGYNGGSSNVYVNGSLVSTITNVNNGNTACLVKYSNSGVYTWNIRLRSPNYSGFGYVTSDSSGNFIVAGNKQSQSNDILNTSGTVIGSLISTNVDAGIVLFINVDGTYSGGYGIIDGTWFEGSIQPILDVNGNIYVTSSAERRIISIYDKNGYVTTKDSLYDNSCGFITKYNANMTLNKISL